MTKLADVLKQAGVKDEVLAGLPPEVVAAADGYVTSADTTLADAKEQLRQAGLTKAEIDQYVETYGANLDRLTTLQATNASMSAFLKSLKEAGTINEIPQFGSAPDNGAQPAVPGSPARGANADYTKLRGEVNGVVNELNSFEDARDEYMLLTGKPIPEKRADLIRQASQARKPLGEFIAEKYKFNEIRQQHADAELQQKLDAARKEGETAATKKFAEERGGNPFVTSPNGNSNVPYVKKINHEEFVNSSGNQPKNVRLSRMLDNIHKDLQQQGA